MGTSIGVTSTSSFYGQCQRRAFYINGRHWVFLSNGTNLVFTSSTDGSTWDSATTVRACTSNYKFGCCHDGTYFHYVYGADGSSTMNYRRGTLGSDGTISWSAVEQSITITSSFAPQPSICVDSGGYAFVGYLSGASGSATPYVVKNANTDGTWSTSGSPMQMNATTNDSWIVGLVVCDGKPLVLYGTDYGTLYAKLYVSGSTWGSEETATSGAGRALHYGYVWAAGVDDSNNVYVSYTCYTAYDVYVITREPSGGTWSYSSALETLTDYVNQTQIAVLPNGDLYVFLQEYPSIDKIYYKKKVSGSWDADWTEFASETNMRDGGRMFCTNDVKSGKIDLYYQAGSGSPYTSYYVGLDTGGEETVNNVYIYYGKFS